MSCQTPYTFYNPLGKFLLMALKFIAQPSSLSSSFFQYLSTYLTSALEYVVADAGNLRIIFVSFSSPNFSPGGKLCWFCLQNLVLICHLSITTAPPSSLVGSLRLFSNILPAHLWPPISPFFHGVVGVVVVKHKPVRFPLHSESLLRWSCVTPLIMSLQSHLRLLLSSMLSTFQPSLNKPNF